MANLTPAEAGRLAVLLAVLMQAGGKVAYGTFLAPVPSPLFVFASFVIAATLFLGFARKGVGEWKWGALVVLNVSTAAAFPSFYEALKLIEPAIAVAVNNGLGPVLAVAIAFALKGEKPTSRRLAICAGILAGCAILCVAAFRGTGLAVGGGSAWLGLAASAVAGVSTVSITVASKSLSEAGWSSGAVLAHRFYILLPLSLLLSLGQRPTRASGRRRRFQSWLPWHWPG